MDNRHTKSTVDNAGLPPFVAGIVIMAVSQTLTFFLSFRERGFLEREQVTPPEITAELPLIYFFGAVAAIGLILLLVPQRVLRLVLKLMFASLFAWGTFIALGLSLPVPAAAATSVVAVSLYLLIPKVWLHNLLMVIALASIATAFGVLFAPWTVILFMLVISIYDILAVRFGYMMWMVKRLSVADTLPAFILPGIKAGWNSKLRKISLFDDKTEKKLSILGGGDIAFPLLLVVSVFFAYGFAGSIVVACFALIGLGAAYWVQRKLLKGKPTPAMPPISLLSIMGFLVVYFT